MCSIWILLYAMWILQLRLKLSKSPRIQWSISHGRTWTSSQKFFWSAVTLLAISMGYSAIEIILECKSRHICLPQKALLKILEVEILLILLKIYFWMKLGKIPCKVNRKLNMLRLTCLTYFTSLNPDISLYYKALQVMSFLLQNSSSKTRLFPVSSVHNFVWFLFQ